jgi:hypothetical protein
MKVSDKLPPDLQAEFDSKLNKEKPPGDADKAKKRADNLKLHTVNAHNKNERTMKFPPVHATFGGSPNPHQPPTFGSPGNDGLPLQRYKEIINKFRSKREEEAEAKRLEKNRRRRERRQLKKQEEADQRSKREEANRLEADQRS